MNHVSTQLSLVPTRPRGQLLKWIGNKFKYADRIVSYFPSDFNTYIEPFVGTGAVLATLAPGTAIAGDVLTPLIQIWHLLQREPETLIQYYSQVIHDFTHDRETTYQKIRNRYNKAPNGLDLVILSRTCYGGVVRFTKEGAMSTPIGPHKPISASAFETRVYEWRERVRFASFRCQTFGESMESASKGDLVYCDPPYIDSQSILYGAQDFDFQELIDCIDRCKSRGVLVALSIDGKKKSKQHTVRLALPHGLFEREIFLSCGSSMLKRFQNVGKLMIGEDVHDRLLLSW